MKIKIMGKVWNLRFAVNMAREKGQALGDCDAPDTVNKEIRIASHLKGEEKLDVILHEILHCAAWHVFDEGFVNQAATDMARALWRLGYRCQGDQDE